MITMLSPLCPSLTALLRGNAMRERLTEMSGWKRPHLSDGSARLILEDARRQCLTFRPVAFYESVM